VGAALLRLMLMKTPKLERASDYWIGRFSAMASSCELLLEVKSASEAKKLLHTAFQEARRIEEKFSRYRSDNIIHRINHANGEAIEVDDETAGLLDYAAQCYALSEGLFDVTSGVLRQAWRFNGSDNVPDTDTVNALLPRIGWHKVKWQRPMLTLPAEMEIDLGGIGKEYAVDRTALLIKQQTSASVLINFGGDLYSTQPRKNGAGWFVGIEDPNQPQIGAKGKHDLLNQFELARGGVATSGDARRFLLKDGKRYSHILNPLTGWPVLNAPHAVTVIADTCTDAGIMATLAMLQGAEAEDFLQAQGVDYKCIRD